MTNCSSEISIGDVDNALLRLMDVLENRSIFDVVFRREAFPDVLPVTWSELKRYSLVKEASDAEGIQLTGYGWSLGLKLQGEYGSAAMTDMVRRLCRAIESFVGRVIGVDEVALRSDLPVAFIKNAIEARLIDDLLELRGPTWSEPSRNILVATDFGLAPTR